MYGESLYLTWDGEPDSLYEWDFDKKENRQIQVYSGKAEHRDGYAGFIIENAYLEEIRAFFAQIGQGQGARYGFGDDLVTLSWIDRIEGAEAGQ